MLRRWRRGKSVAGLAYRRRCHLAAEAASRGVGGVLVSFLVRRIAEPTFLQQLPHMQKQLCLLSDLRVSRWVSTADSKVGLQHLPDLGDLLHRALDGSVDIDVLPVFL